MATEQELEQELERELRRRPSHIPALVLDDVPRMDGESCDAATVLARRRARLMEGQSSAPRAAKKKLADAQMLDLLKSSSSAHSPISSANVKSKKLAVRSRKETANDRVKSGSGQVDDLGGSSQQQASRKEVIALHKNMHSLLSRLGRDSETKEYPTEMHALIKIAQEEQQIFDSVFEEIARQVTINMLERGEILSEVRRRYSFLFNQIPAIVKIMHAELVAHRKVNKRLSKEILRARNTIFTLSQQLEHVKHANEVVEKQGSQAQQKLLEILARTENVDDIMKEYHKLYRMQRKRLEDSIKTIGREKYMWVDAATNLALRIGTEHGISDVTTLQKFEYGRVRAANHMISIIGQHCHDECTTLSRRAEEWKDKFKLVANAIEIEDAKCQAVVIRVNREMRVMHKSLDLDDTEELEIYPDAKLVDEVEELNKFDTRNAQQTLLKWVQQIGILADRYTSERDDPLVHEMSVIGKLTEAWYNMGLAMLRKSEMNTTGRDYVEHERALKELMHSVDQVQRKMHIRLTGSDGVVGQAIGLQNLLEDRYTAFAARDTTKPMNMTEKAILAESLVNWSSLLAQLSNVYTSSINNDREKILMSTESWLSRIQDQVATDGELLSEDNIKLHNTMISWMVKLLIKTGKQMPDASWDVEFGQTCKAVLTFNQNLLQDSSDIEMLSDDHKELRAINNWLNVAKRLLETEKISGAKRLAAAAAPPPIIQIPSGSTSSGSSNENSQVEGAIKEQEKVTYYSSDLLAEGLDGRGEYPDSDVLPVPKIEHTWTTSPDSLGPLSLNPNIPQPANTISGN